ncbi:MAG: hypothetical protein ACTSW1_16475 [Candidatus Hodarchaeales archaeon]
MSRQYWQIIMSKEDGWCLTLKGSGTLTVTKPANSPFHHFVSKIDAVSSENFEVEILNGTAYLWQINSSANQRVSEPFDPALKGSVGTAVSAKVKAPNTGTSFINLVGWSG